MKLFLTRVLDHKWVFNAPDGTVVTIVGDNITNSTVANSEAAVLVYYRNSAVNRCVSLEELHAVLFLMFDDDIVNIEDVYETVFYVTVA